MVVRVLRVGELNHLSVVIDQASTGWSAMFFMTGFLDLHMDFDFDEYHRCWNDVRAACRKSEGFIWHSAVQMLPVLCDLSLLPVSLSLHSSKAHISVSIVHVACLISDRPVSLSSSAVWAPALFVLLSIFVFAVVFLPVATL